jgi:hypothetical protein
MLFALLAYHVEELIDALTPAEDAALMADLRQVQARMFPAGELGPAARLGPTAGARTVRRGERPLVIDGPFAETKEQLLGFYILNVPDIEQAIEAAEAMGAVNPTAVYEIRPIRTFLPGAPIKAS